jgi:hypothetical protein
MSCCQNKLARIQIKVTIVRYPLPGFTQLALLILGVLATSSLGKKEMERPEPVPIASSFSPHQCIAHVLLTRDFKVAPPSLA